MKIIHIPFMIIFAKMIAIMCEPNNNSVYHAGTVHSCNCTGITIFIFYMR